MRTALLIFRRLGRILILLFLVAMGTILLMRRAPGYFADAGEMDVKYAQSHLQPRDKQIALITARSIACSTLSMWIKGNLGQSRQYDVPVSDLIRPRLRVTAALLVRGIGYAWLLAFCAALPLSTMRAGPGLFGTPFTVLLAIPTGAMATLCLLSSLGGPVLVLTLLLAARDFKFLDRLFRVAWRAPHLLQARAQGLRLHQLVTFNVIPNVLPNLLALATLSLITALSAIVPIEVLFDVPGVGQLAWSAALNRDLPVLLAVTLLMAAAVACAGLISQQARPLETA